VDEACGKQLLHFSTFSLVTTQQKLNEAEESLSLFIKHINHYVLQLRVSIAAARAIEA
jgi:hypothetical protein